MNGREQRIAERLFHVLPPGWRSATVELRATGRYWECDATVTPMVGRPVAWTPPDDVIDLLRDARAADYRDGTWLGIWIGMDFPLEARFAYNTDQQPAWTGTPPPVTYAEELQLFPRSRPPQWLLAAATVAFDETGWPLADEPPLSLFANRRLVSLPVGCEIDRFGSPAGNLCYAAGTEYAYRSLPAEALASGYRRYRLARPTEALTGTAVPWFGQPGGGVGHYLPGSLADLVSAGTLTEVHHVVGHAPWPEDATVTTTSWPILPLPSEPPLSLFAEPSVIELAAETRVEHYGGPDGNLVYPAGTAFAATSLPSAWEGRSRLSLRLRRPIQVIAGTAVPWSDAPGGSTGYYLPAPILSLLRDQTLVEVAG